MPFSRAESSRLQKKGLVSPGISKNIGNPRLPFSPSFNPDQAKK
jgi:hypothetical protein